MGERVAGGELGGGALPGAAGAGRGRGGRVGVGVRCCRGECGRACGDADELGRGLAGGGAGAVALGLGAGVARIHQDMVFVVDEAVEHEAERGDGGADAAEGEEAGAAGERGLEAVELRGDVGAGHPGGQGLDGDLGASGDVLNGFIGIGEAEEELFGGVAVGLKDVDGRIGRESGQWHRRTPQSRGWVRGRSASGGRSGGASGKGSVQYSLGFARYLGRFLFGVV